MTKKAKAHRVSLDLMAEPLEIEVNGKVFTATRLADQPMSRQEEVDQVSKALEAATDAEARTMAMVEFIQVCIPTFTDKDLLALTGRQVNKLVETLGEGMGGA